MSDKGFVGHSVDTLEVGAFDGTITCTCSWSKYQTYPGTGWGKRSVGIMNKFATKKLWVTNSLTFKYMGHAKGMTDAAVRYGN